MTQGSSDFHRDRTAAKKKPASRQRPGHFVLRLKPQTVRAEANASVKNSPRKYFGLIDFETMPLFCPTCQPSLGSPSPSHVIASAATVAASTVHGVVLRIFNVPVTALMKKPGLANEAGPFSLTARAADQPRVRERIIKLS
ncbi:hypothetical protein [Bradyrhizobium guangdongense]